MSAEEFESLISLETLAISDEGEYSFWFRDGDIFAGHVIIVYGKLDGGFYDAEMAG